MSYLLTFLQNMCFILADFSSSVDTLVSTTWMFMTFLGLLIALSIFFTVYNPFRTKWHNYILPTFFAIAALFSLIFLTRGPYGKAWTFIDAASNEKQIAFIETHEVGDGDGGTSTVYRLYTFDLATGNKLVRQLVDYPRILTMTDKMVVMNEFDGVVGYDIFTGDVLKTWTKESGFEKYPELKVGINNMSASSQQKENHTEAYITITAMDGNQYYFDIVAEKLHRGTVPYRADEFSDYSIRLENRDYYFFQKESGEIDRMTMQGERGTIAFQETFLEPKIIAFDGKGVIVVRHFETLEKKNAILTAVDLGMKKLWDVKQRDLVGVSDDSDDMEAGESIYTNGKLVTTFGGRMICINATDGKVLWQIAP